MEAYRKRRDAMFAAMKEHFPTSVSWSRPAAVAEKVMYVPGSCDYAGGGGTNALRLNFSAYTEDTINGGIERLAKVIKQS